MSAPSQVCLNNGRIVLDFVGSALCNDLAVADHRNCLADVHNQIHIMLNEEDSDLEIITDAADLMHQFRGFAGVHTRSRLVQQDNRRIGSQCTADLQTTLNTVGQAACLLVSDICKAHKLQQFHSLLICLLLSLVVAGQTQQRSNKRALHFIVHTNLDVIQSAIGVLRAFGADETMFKVHINNRRFFNDVIAAICGTDAEGSRKVSKIVDRKNKVTREAYVKDMNELGITEEQIGKIDALYTMNVKDATALCPESVGSKELISLFDALEATSLLKYCVFDFGIIRGLDYYTGTVFEVFDEDPENNRAMFGGGRYDNLVGLFAKNAKVSGVGYGMGDVTLENFLVSHKLVPDLYGEGYKVLVTRFEDVPYENYIALVDKLRALGVTSTVYIGTKKFGKQIDFAVKDNYTHVAIMGGDELAAGKVKIKNLNTREEAEVELAKLGEYFV